MAIDTKRRSKRNERALKKNQIKISQRINLVAIFIAYLWKCLCFVCANVDYISAMYLGLHFIYFFFYFIFVLFLKYVTLIWGNMVVDWIWMLGCGRVWLKMINSICKKKKWERVRKAFSNIFISKHKCIKYDFNNSLNKKNQTEWIEMIGWHTKTKFNYTADCHFHTHHTLFFFILLFIICDRCIRLNHTHTHTHSNWTCITLFYSFNWNNWECEKRKEEIRKILKKKKQQRIRWTIKMHFQLVQSTAFWNMIWESDALGTEQWTSSGANDCIHERIQCNVHIAHSKICDNLKILFFFSSFVFICYHRGSSAKSDGDA